MLTWIISTAQQARPKVIHHSEPVRAHWNSSSVEVTRKPLSDLGVQIGEERLIGRRNRAVAGGGRIDEMLLIPSPELPFSTHRQGRSPVRPGTPSS
jgi:hypothetical protein